MKRAMLIGLLGLAGCVGTSRFGVEMDTIEIAANEKIVFQHASELSRSCRPLDIPEITVLRQPQHGYVMHYPAKFYPIGFNPGNFRYKCRDRLVDGVEILYQPSRDFRGTDSAKIRIGYHYGEGEVPKSHFVDVDTTFVMR